MEIKIKKLVAKLVMDTNLFLENLKETTSISDAVFYTLSITEKQQEEASKENELEEYSDFICSNVDWVILIDNIKELDIKEVNFEIYRVNINEIVRYSTIYTDKDTIYVGEEKVNDSYLLLVSNYVDKKYAMNHGIDRLINARVYSFPSLDIEAKDLNT